MKKFPLLKTKIEIPEITSKVVDIEFPRPLRASWTHEIAQDISAEHITMLSEQLYNEIEMNLRKFSIPRW